MSVLNGAVMLRPSMPACLAVAIISRGARSGEAYIRGVHAKLPECRVEHDGALACEDRVAGDCVGSCHAAPPPPGAIDPRMPLSVSWSIWPSAVCRSSESEAKVKGLPQKGAATRVILPASPIPTTTISFAGIEKAEEPAVVRPALDRARDLYDVRPHPEGRGNDFLRARLRSGVPA